MTILWPKHWVKAGLERAAFIGDEFEVNWDEHSFLTDESFHHHSFKLNKQFSIMWMLSDAMENFIFCFLNMVFAAVLFLKYNKWSYSYGFLFESHC